MLFRSPQSLRMSGEQKLKDGDEVLFTCESTNSVELLFFTNHRQVYKSHAYDFNDSKASVLGDYVASTLGTVSYTHLPCPFLTRTT